MNQSLDLRQSQQLIMTPQLRQAIEMLQLNNQDLSTLVDKEIAQNPLLEKEEPASEEVSMEESSTEAATDESAQDFDSGQEQMGSGGDTKFEGYGDDFESRLSDEISLRDHLLEQLHISFDDQRDHLIGAMLIDSLDEYGYLRENPEKLAEQLGCSQERIDNLLGEMKKFDPTGIFASDLTECMMLQLEEQNNLDEPMKVLVQHLDLLANHDLQKLKKTCDVDDERLQEMIADIRRLNPRPAGEFEHFISQTVVPDVLMKAIPKHLGGGWRVELNNDTLPRVLVNNEYYTTVMSRSNSQEDKTYLNNQLTAANWLARALEQRAQTILKTASVIIEEQNAFFLYGVEYLTPMTLKQVAEKIDMHESTVSRVTTSKYIGTPRGLFELKYFFTTGLSGEGGMSHSAESVRARIKTYIDAEDPKKILSDDGLAEMLQKDGIDVARRTVAKYREAMNIPSSVQRRRMKKHQNK